MTNQLHLLVSIFFDALPFSSAANIEVVRSCTLALSVRESRDRQEMVF